MADETADYLKGVAQARHWPSSACWKCHRKHPAPHRCPAPPYWHRLVIAAVFVGFAAAGVLVWFVPPFAWVANFVAWPIAVIGWAVVGWRARARRNRRGGGR